MAPSLVVALGTCCEKILYVFFILLGEVALILYKISAGDVRMAAPCQVIVIGTLHNRVIVLVSLVMPAGHVAIQVAPELATVPDHSAHRHTSRAISDSKDDHGTE